MSSPSVLTGPKSPVSVPNPLAGILSGNLGGVQNPDSFLQTLNTTLIPMLFTMIASQKYSPNIKRSIRHEYDYIIVGAGTAGSVVASRLSEKECVSVLVLEAGKPPPIVSEIPGLERILLATDANWNYLTEPQEHAAAQMFDRRIPYPCGKVIGGSSVINAMLYVRGNHLDYDEWEKMGAKGWSWKDVFPYFLKLENNTDPEIRDNGYHNAGGPVTASRIRYNPDLKNSVLEAGKALGYEIVDCNGENQIGFDDLQANIRDGQRCSSAKAYLVPADDRPNLDIVSEAFVKKIRIRHRRARGVYVDHKGTCRYVKARKEVIISAGAVNTPQILMLSGIGPRKILENLKIPVKADLPVGENLQDHVTGLMFFSVSPPALPAEVKVLNPASILEYATNRSGILASPSAIFSIAFLRSNYSDVAESIPDYGIYFLEGSSTFARLTVGIKPLVFEQLFLPYELSATMFCYNLVLRPKSRGYVRIRSSDPYDPPLINTNFLQDPQDLKVMVAGMKSCLDVARSRAVRDAGVKPFETLMPGCECFAKDENRYLECYAKSLTLTNYHQSGTAKMGDFNDPTTVVDPELRVKGITGLRVVDASIMPKIVSGNTNIPTTMIGEKASDIIKKTIKCPHP